jgi:hypothetical protein
VAYGTRFLEAWVGTRSNGKEEEVTHKRGEREREREREREMLEGKAGRGRGREKRKVEKVERELEREREEEKRGKREKLWGRRWRWHAFMELQRDVIGWPGIGDEECRAGKLRYFF